MRELNENLLQFIWRQRLLKPGPLLTVSGSPINIFSPGELNTDSGPDFFNARININGITLAGNIEIHVRSGDWKRHGHEADKSYDNIILHVVYEHNGIIEQNRLNNVEVLSLHDKIPQEVFDRYESLTRNRDVLACASQLERADDSRFTMWLQRMMVERLENKTAWLGKTLSSGGGDHIFAFYVLLLRNFGFKVNAVPFELIARHLPYKILLRHAADIFQTEALLFGVSGLLNRTFTNKYLINLQNEAEHLMKKYSLGSLKAELFKFSRMRPANFPTVRLAQLATLIHRRPELLVRPDEFNSYEKIASALDVQPKGYWKNHYVADSGETDYDLSAGKDAIENIIINTFAPFFFFHGRHTGKSGYQETALELLEQCGFESNAKTRLFRKKNHCLNSAACSQALIHLHDNYCLKKSCLKCGIAAAILKNS